MGAPGVFSRTLRPYTPNLQRALRELDALVDWERRRRTGPPGSHRLMRVTCAPASNLLSRLGSPERSFTSVHVAGSKGKGSVAALIAAGLGPRTGIFSSPHVERVTERVRLGGRPISEDSLASTLLEALAARSSHPEITSATWFDTIFAAACLAFARRNVTHAVLEAGMGARRDATAAVDAKVAVVTNVALEHAEIIGPTLLDIAREKAGAIRPGCIAVVGMGKSDEFAHVFINEANAQSPPAQVLFVPPEKGASLRAQNSAIARTALEALGFSNCLSDKTISDTLASLPARQELFQIPVDDSRKRIRVTLDGAHIPTSVAAVLQEANALPENFIVVLGIGAEKDVDSICNVIKDLKPRVVFATATGPETVYLPASRLGRALYKAGVPTSHVRIVENPVDATHHALCEAAITKDPVIVTGSLHLAGKIRPFLCAKAQGLEETETEKVARSVVGES